MKGALQGDAFSNPMGTFSDRAAEAGGAFSGAVSAATGAVSEAASAAAAAASTACGIDTTRFQECRGGSSAATIHIKILATLFIFVTSVVGICFPVLLARCLHGRPVYDKTVLVIKCFAAGIILSTSLVHVIPDSFDALGDCRVATRSPWKDFPFPGVITLVGALLALFVDITSASRVRDNSHAIAPYVPVGTSEELVFMARKSAEYGLESAAGNGREGSTEEELGRMKQRLVSQVLEMGIVFHSLFIGLTMGMSQNQCTIKPLLAALAFHQIFGGLGLGGCIAQAGFRFGTIAYMCMVFSVTTPLGIVLGMMVFRLTQFEVNSPNALILEGVFSGVSSGILLYMALVDLTAIDFFHNKTMESSRWLKNGCYIALVIGAAAMSALALWT